MKRYIRQHKCKIDPVKTSSVCVRRHMEHMNSLLYMKHSLTCSQRPFSHLKWMLDLVKIGASPNAYILSHCFGGMVAFPNQTWAIILCKIDCYGLASRQRLALVFLATVKYASIHWRNREKEEATLNLVR